MKKSIIIFVTSIALSAGMVIYGWAFVDSRVGEVSLTEETMAGNKAAADGLTVGFRADSADNLHWISSYDYNTDKTDSSFKRGEMTETIDASVYDDIRFTGWSTVPFSTRLKCDRLEGLQEKLSRLAEKLSCCGVLLLSSMGIIAVFCNQTIGVIMQSQLASSLYTDTDEERRAVIDASDMKHKYDKAIDNFSAYEYFEQQNGEPEKEEERAAKQVEREEKKAARNAKKPTAAAKTVKKKKSAASKAMTRVTNSAMSTIGRELGRSIIRGIFGSIK